MLAVVTAVRHYLSISSLYLNFFFQNSYDKIIYTFLSRKKKGMSVMFLKMWGKIKSTEEHGAKK